mgnify:CR=1 FL=1
MKTVITSLLQALFALKVVSVSCRKKQALQVLADIHTSYGIYSTPADISKALKSVEIDRKQKSMENYNFLFLAYPK